MNTTRRRSPGSVDIGTQGGTGYIWLAYSAFFFIDPVLRHESRFWLQCIVIYAVFLAVYIGYMRSQTLRQRYVLLGAFFLLGVVSLPINSGASSFFIYASAFLPFAVASVPAVVGLIALECLFLVAEGLWLHINPFFISTIAFFIAVVGTGNFFIAQQKRADSKLRMANDEIEQLAAVAERERIARDLHDVLGHTLSVIVLKAELAGRLIERDPQRAAQEMSDVEKTARTALSEVREAIGGYRSQGLPAEMERARTTLNAADVALSCESTLPKVTAAEETVLCLTVREAVTNIVRHAGAKHCRMRFATTKDNYLSLLVEDDGTHALLCEGNGLRGMRERVQAMGGRFSINTHEGTALLIELPVARRSAAAAQDCVAL
jgi:two-component system, NarL family, sensor histidine kinase DesK